jgi:osmoprotectant transport system permease protein
MNANVARSNSGIFWMILALILSFMVGVAAENKGLLQFAREHPGDIRMLLLQHIQLVLTAGAVAVCMGVPTGILLTRGFMRRYKEFLLNLLGICQTVPSLAVLALAMTYLGIGKKTAIFALTVYALLPIIRNTVAGIGGVSEVALDAGRGMGMTPLQLLLKVELPNAMYIILTGIRMSIVIMVGTAALSFKIGGGGLGDLIFTGIAMVDTGYMLTGAVPTAALAITLNWFFGLLEKWIISPGLTYDT